MIFDHFFLGVNMSVYDFSSLSNSLGNIEMFEKNNKNMKAEDFGIEVSHIQNPDTGEIEAVEVTFARKIRKKFYPYSTDSLDIYYQEFGWVYFDIIFQGHKKFKIIVSLDYNEITDEGAFETIYEQSF